MDLKIVYSTFPSVATAEAAARHLVAQRLAACGNILPGLISFYEWEGALERAEEVVLLLKTRAGQLAPLMDALRALHPYEVPAILSLDVEAADAPFAGWVRAQTVDAAKD
ncbi:divalent-cation tolerance protein CutA [Aquabacter sp. L1I39]|uniref:divalent-cation tolerance protein CutA n=1 Tax=Aquabacter sp. L1I39 TaxID=2820278 RepID=UPI001ADA0CFA|nr:divalent-cation tolerance protein CutA [Aquabacter sp. L1I39]QTL03301.1 divalent-cation tolerance protein CutA [Aquabacter sp. L1I39]